MADPLNPFAASKSGEWKALPRELSEPVEVTWVGTKITFKGSRVTVVLDIDSREMRTVYNGRRGKGHIKVKVDEDGPPIEIL